MYLEPNAYIITNKYKAVKREICHINAYYQILSRSIVGLNYFFLQISSELSLTVTICQSISAVNII